MRTNSRLTGFILIVAVWSSFIRFFMVPEGVSLPLPFNLLKLKTKLEVKFDTITFCTWDANIYFLEIDEHRAWFCQNTRFQYMKLYSLMRMMRKQMLGFPENTVISNHHIQICSGIHPASSSPGCFLPTPNAARALSGNSHPSKEKKNKVFMAFFFQSPTCL